MKKIILINTFLFLIFMQVFANNIRGGLPFFFNYHPNDYSGYSQNWSAAINSKGFLFVANGDGVLMYNGSDWEKFLIANNVTPSSLLCDENDVIWVGSQSELGCLAPDAKQGYRYVSLINLVNPKYRNFNYIYSIKKIKNSIYFLTSENIFCLQSDKITRIFVNKSSHLFYKNKNLFIYEPLKGFSQVVGDKLIKIPNNFADVKMHIRSVIDLGGDSAIIVDKNSGIKKIKLDFSNYNKVNIIIKNLNLKIDTLLVNSDVSNALRLHNGNYAFATQRDGTFITDSAFNILYNLSREVGVLNESHNFLIEDKQNNLWIMMDNGICKVNSQSPLSGFNDFQGVKGSVLDVNRFIGRLFVATWQGVFYENIDFQKNKKNIFLPIDNIVKQSWDIENIKLDDKNYLLIATTDGVYLIDELLNSKLILPDRGLFVNPIPDDNRFVYIVSSDDIMLLDFSKNIFKPKITKLPNFNKRNTYAKFTKDNDLVVSTALNGIYIFHTDSSFTESDTIIYNYKNINNEDGLPITEKYSIFNFQDKILISTTASNRLYVLEKRNNKYSISKLEYNNLPNFQMSGSVNSLIEDENGNVWLQIVSKQYGRKKLYYITCADELKFISKPFSGFPELDYHSIFPDGDSLVWLGTDDGLYRFNWKVSNSFSLDKDFSTVISKISFNDKIIKHPISKQIVEDEQVTQTFKKGNIRFDFSAGYYINERKIKYSYILEGYDEKWSAPSFENHKEYTNLPHGVYTFKVKAINPFGAVGKIDEFSFEILTPWYYSFWAISSGIILAFLLVFAIVKYSNRRLIKAKIRLENIIQNRTAEVHEQKKAIELEKEKADKLLLNILPVRIAEELKATGHCKTEFYESVTVLFTDMCGFTKIAEITDPDELVLKLDTIFTKFDEICSRNKLEKIKTVGDSHMSAGGIPVRNNTHAIDAVLAAMEMQQYIERKVNVDANNAAWKLRIGINTGELTAGVVGKKKFAFDIWGDTVNTASRLQDAGEPSKINISTSTASLVSDFFELKYRGKRPIKHKGEVDMFFVEGIKPELSINGEMIKPNKFFWEKYYELVELKQLDF